MNLMSEGGVLLLVILMMTVVAAMVFLDRLLRLRKIAIDYQDFLQGVFTVLDKGNITEALAICEEAPGPIAAIVSEAIIQRNAPSENLREILAATAQSEISRLERRILLLSLFAYLMPLVGLIGTLCGAYELLMNIDQAMPLITLSTLSAPLAKALITTIAGLVSAGACYTMHHILLTRIDTLVLDVDTTAALTLNHLQQHKELIDGHV